MYEIQIEQGVERDLKNLNKKLSREDFNQIISAILSLKHTPRPMGTCKIVGSKNDWRIRMGNYRIIYEIDDRKQVVKIFRVKHRKDVYKLR